MGRAAPTRAGVLLLSGGDETPHVGAAFQLPKHTFQPPSLTPNPFPGAPSQAARPHPDFTPEDARRRYLGAL